MSGMFGNLKIIRQCKKTVKKNKIMFTRRFAIATKGLQFSHKCVIL